MSLQHKEVEFKYRAKVSLTDFHKFCTTTRNPVKYLLISGWDSFYSNTDLPTSFYRHRINTLENQLTFKKKISLDNNFIREEHNIDLPLSVSDQKVSDLCGVHGYKYNISIFKNCFIYNYEYYTLVFYIVYDLNLNELDRFIEIEMKEDYDWGSEEEAYSSLITLEKLCKSLSIGPDERVNKSLYEMYKKDIL